MSRRNAVTCDTTPASSPPTRAPLVETPVAQRFRADGDGDAAPSMGQRIGESRGKPTATTSPAPSQAPSPPTPRAIRLRRHHSPGPVRAAASLDLISPLTARASRAGTMVTRSFAPLPRRIISSRRSKSTSFTRNARHSPSRSAIQQHRNQVDITTQLAKDSPHFGA